MRNHDYPNHACDYCPDPKKERKCKGWTSDCKNPNCPALRNLIEKERAEILLNMVEAKEQIKRQARHDAFKECIEILEAEKQRLMKWGVKDLNPIIVFTDLITSLSQKSHE